MRGCFGFGEGEGVIEDLLELFIGKRQQLRELCERHDREWREEEGGEVIGKEKEKLKLQMISASTWSRDVRGVSIPTVEVQRQCTMSYPESLAVILLLALTCDQNLHAIFYSFFDVSELWYLKK